MCLTGAYQCIGLFVDKDITQALRQAISTRGSLMELSLSETENGGVLSISTIISPDYNKSFDDYKDAVDTKSCAKNIAVTSELKDNKTQDNLDDCDFEINLDDYIWRDID